VKLIDLIKLSFSNLFRQKMRTFLTVISIVIGATLISLVYSIIPGFENFLNVQLNTLNSKKVIDVTASSNRPGADLLSSLTGGPQEYKDGEETSSVDFEFEAFTDEDIENMKNIGGVKDVYESPTPSVEYLRLENQDKRFKTSFVFFYPKFLLENLNIVSGRKIEDDEEGKILLSYDYIEAFGYENPDDLIGKKVILHSKQTLEQSMSMSPLSEEVEQEEKDFELEIVGIAEKNILSSVIFISFKDAVEITKFSKGTEEVLTDNDEARFSAWVELESEELADEVKAEIEELGFRARTYEDSKDVLNDIFDVLTVTFSSFGILAMAVSSLGIINTLIMAVYERTREIGVLKAIGATRFNIASLFTIEASMIGVIGGIIGLGIGFGISEIIDIWGHKTILSTFETLDLSNVSPLLLLGPVLSTVIATIAGIYPALRASKLNPVEALRYE